MVLRSLCIISGFITLSCCEESLGRRRPEDSIPVVEIRGEGKPMTASQIRALEEASNGGPLDVKIEKTWIPTNCSHPAKRRDFVTFHYKGFLEDSKKFDQTYGRDPITIQLGTGMAMPGLEKALRGMCSTELRKVSIPYRLSRKKKSRVWKNIPNDEHWLIFNIEMLEVVPWSIADQFQFLDHNNDSFLTENELIQGLERDRKNYGKTWRNEDIDDVLAVKYYLTYFDADADQKISSGEYRTVMQRDIDLMDKAKANPSQKKGRSRDPGVAWILDFDNDGVVSYEELESADQTIQKEPILKPNPVKKDEL